MPEQNTTPETPKVPIGPTSIAGYSVTALGVAAAIVAFVQGDRSEQTLGVLVSAGIAALAFGITQAGRYVQAHALVVASTPTTVVPALVAGEAIAQGGPVMLGGPEAPLVPPGFVPLGDPDVDVPGAPRDSEPVTEWDRAIEGEGYAAPESVAIGEAVVPVAEAELRDLHDQGTPLPPAAPERGTYDDAGGLRP